jgi:hypothetical protein
MQSSLLVLSYIAKMAGCSAARNGVALVAPVTGVIIFFSAWLLKETVVRIGDCLDIGKPDRKAELPAERRMPEVIP